MGKWLQTIVRAGQRANILPVNRKKSNIVWPTIVGLSIATIVTMRSNRSRKWIAPVEKVIKQIQPDREKIGQLATEFAQELTEKLNKDS